MVASILGPDLFSSPHVASIVIRMFDEAWEPDPEELKQVIEHMITCTACQGSLGMLFLGCVDTISSKGEYDAEVRVILAELREILHETRLLNDLSGYADVLERRGKKAAKEQYPEFAKHEKHCKVCQEEVKNTRKLIRKADKDRLLVLPEADSTS